MTTTYTSEYVHLSDHESEINLLSQRIGELQRLNEEKTTRIRHLEEESRETISLTRNEIRESILQFAHIYDIERDVLNSLLDDLDMEQVPTSYTVAVTLKATLVVAAGPGSPTRPNNQWITEQLTAGNIPIDVHHTSELALDDWDVEDFTAEIVEVH